MILAALAFVIGAPTDPVQFHHGKWSGQCYRQGSLNGMDHELCLARIFIETGAQLERSAEGLSVQPYVGGGCTGADLKSSFLPSSALAGHNRARVVAEFARSKIAEALKTCHLHRPIPAIRPSDIDAFLLASDRLKPDSFVLLDPSARAPAAEKCGNQLEQGWRAGLKSYALPAGGRVNLMMYTFSKKGPQRAEKRFAAHPEIMENFFAMGMGPGGMTIEARKSADAWRDPPTDWFMTLCDIGIEAWSSFVELAAYPEKDGQPPIFGVRASTGVAAGRGFVITQQPLIPGSR